MVIHIISKRMAGGDTAISRETYDSLRVHETEYWKLERNRCELLCFGEVMEGTIPTTFISS